MKIILYKDVPNLGEEGDVKTVADGYARNFLIPKKFAVPYTKSTEVELEQKRQAIERRKEAKKQEAMGLKDRISSQTVEISLPAGDKGKLFGSVTNAVIADELGAKGIEVERKKIDLPDHGIKVVGTHTAKVKLYGGEVAELTVVVSASGEKPPVVEEEAVSPETETAAADEKPSVDPRIDHPEEEIIPEAETQEAATEEVAAEAPTDEPDKAVEEEAPVEDAAGEEAVTDDEKSAGSEA